MDQHEPDLNGRDDTPPTEDGLQQPDPELLSRRPVELRWLVLGSLGLAGLIALIVTLVLSLVAAPVGQEKEPAPPTEQPAPPPHQLAYEEPLSVDLQEQAIHVDSALMRTLLKLGAVPESIESYAFPARGSEEFRARSIGLSVPVTAVEFQNALAEELQGEVPDAVLAPSGPRQFSIILSGVRTHELFLESPAEDSIAATPYEPTVPELPAKIVGKLAIVIDDMGEDTRLARGLANTGLPITFAVWPGSSHRDAIRAMATENGLDLIVHQPMEPMSYPENHPGPDALYTSMTADEITETMNKNLDLVPEAIGVNNHMGSRFTTDLSGMTAALKVLARRGLFFLDSRTTGKTRGPAAATEAGVPFYGRDVFLDNERNVPYILNQLKKAEALARRRGSAIAIGHPHPETLEAIRTWAANAKGDVAVVGISGLEPAQP